MRLAIPNKGRLVEPTLALLHDAGLVFDEHPQQLDHLVLTPLDVLHDLACAHAESCHLKMPGL